ncbi:MAG: DUF5060 domain-containing protein [Ginsengibacter sp.]
MKTTCLSFISILLFNFFSGLAQKNNGEIIATDSKKIIEQWKVHEVNLISEKEYADPFNEVSVDAIFSGPGGETIKRPAFWDGGKTWKIRFAPTKKGWLV